MTMSFLLCDKLIIPIHIINIKHYKDYTEQWDALSDRWWMDVAGHIYVYDSHSEFTLRYGLLLVWIRYNLTFWKSASPNARTAHVW